MIAIIIIIAVLLLIALLRVGVSAEYGENGVAVRIHAGPVSVAVFPRPEKPKKPKREKKQKKSEGAEAERKPGTVKKLRELLPAVKKALGRFRRKLLVNELTVWYLAASEDPYSAVMSFGYAEAAMGAVTPLLELLFRIRKRDFRASVSFTAPEPYIYVKARLSLAVWQAVFIGAGFLADYLKSSAKRDGKEKNGKGMITNG